MRLRRQIANNITSSRETDLPGAREHKAGFGQRVCILCSSLILVIVACTQLYSAHVRNLTPWEGGGFGMFSTVDSMNNRLLRCTLITDRGDFPVEVPPSVQHLIRKSTSIPTPETLSDFARQLAQLTWEPSSGSATSETSNGTQASEPDYRMIAKGEYYGHTSQHFQLETGNKANVLGARVEVMRLAFDAREHRLNFEKILAATENRQD